MLFLYDELFKILMNSNVAEKCADINRLHLVLDRYFPLQTGKMKKALRIEIPGRPALPKLVSPQHVPRRSMQTQEGRAALIHAIAHIEFNAMNLAIDAAYRFRGLPDQYIKDWIRVAAEEAFHFRLLEDRLHALGFKYGDFNAHDGLWKMALTTDHDPLIRMALVPRLMEARGLDVTPDIRARFQSVEDKKTVDVLNQIERDEIEHVRIGNKWYHYLCNEQGVAPLDTFIKLLREYAPKYLRGPYNWKARMKAGFTPAEMAWLREKEENPTLV